LEVRFRYDVMVSIARIWSVDRSFAERDDALAHARAVPTTRPRVDGVKVLRYRITSAGETFETVILQEEEPNRRRVARIALVDDAPVCMTGTDLMTLSGRRVISRVLAGFLESETITPSELLHQAGHASRLKARGGLLEDAVHRVARVQSRRTRGSAGACARRLFDLLHTMEADLAALEADKRRLPAFSPTDVAAFSQAVERAVGSERHGRVLMAALTDHLAVCIGLGQKLDRALMMLAQKLDPVAETLIEGLLADLLAFPSVLRDLFGPFPCLGERLFRLADLLHGRPPPAGLPPSPRLEAVTLLIRSGRAPACASVLLERLLDDLEGGKPLDARDAEAEAPLLEELASRLRGADGELLGGTRAEAAIARRELANRQSMLRRMGLHDVADALPKVWRPA
jgi:hypothetical protein